MAKALFVTAITPHDPPLPPSHRAGRTRARAPRRVHRGTTVTLAELVEVLVSRLAGQAAAVPPSGAVEGDIFYRTLSIDENSVISARRL